ncbi:Cysteine proteinase inhibitor [Thalictrum thalictroides]|uniref:Cysteine proteinase inhibitor n=1 Tax=Thalictrum thalictroides TaxID=46969 RepID=A0A7J6WSF9_THATH|nr:Cysteine proteinase inhibitor [Thalictrum thalictroides]
MVSVLGDDGLGGGKLGGRTEIIDLKTNKEVQDLGKYSVDEYSLQHKGELGVKGILNFVEVKEAQMQVVSGIKYYLKVNVIQNGMSKIFDAVVVVRPWDRSKELVQFAPYAN